MEEGLPLLLDVEDEEEIWQPKRPRLEEEKQSTGDVVERLEEEEEEELDVCSYDSDEGRQEMINLYRESIPLKPDWIKTLDYPRDRSDISTFVSNKEICYFHVAASVECGGYAAILRDNSRTPLIAECGVLSDSEKEKCASAFYTELKGVSTALKMALRYGVKMFHIVPANDYVAYFVHCACRGRAYDLTKSTAYDSSLDDGYDDDDMCLCLFGNYPCVEHVEDLLLQPQDKEDIRVIYPLIVDMISDVLKLLQRDYLLFSVAREVPAEKTRAAQHLAKLGKVQEMMPSDMLKSEDLTNILYEDSILY